MSTSNRLKQKKAIASSSTTQQPQQQVEVTGKRSRAKIFTSSKKQSRQNEYEQYVAYKNCNPLGVQFTMEYFPANFELAQSCSLPVGFSFSPMLALENEHAVVMDKNIDIVPRCGICRAYMNCYNTIEKGKFICFMCNSANYIGDYKPQEEPRMELTYSIYQAIGSQNYYQHIATQQTIIFIIDITNSSSNIQILQYASSCIKQILSRPEFDQTILQIYAYDRVVYEFSFTGEEIKCMVIDRNIREEVGKFGQKVIHCREYLDVVFDALGDMCKENQQYRGDFTESFQYIYSLTKQTGARYYIIQSSESLIGQPLITQSVKPDPNQPAKIPKSLFQTKNGTFMKKYADAMYANGNNICLFVFGKSYKNIKVFSDAFKVLNCSLKYYSKDSISELQKFYYQFSYLLGANYYKDVKTEFIIGDGFQFMSIYGGAHRIKQNITFSCVQIQSSREYFALLGPSKIRKQHPLYCTVQVITNYRFKGQHFISVATIIQTISDSLQKIYGGINCQMALAMNCKTFLSNLRIQSSKEAHKRHVQTGSLIYKNALRFFKSKDKIPESVMYMLMGNLAMVKSLHSQPQIISNAPAFDRICSERNYLQFCNGSDLSSYFMPYLFDLNNMDQTMCQDVNQFIYPPTLQVKFTNVKVGIFLLDAGLCMYLFIAKQCDLYLLKNLLGKQKISRQDRLTQQIIQNQNTLQSRQLLCLIQYLRQQKCYGWIPLHIVHCGQNTPNQRNFYLQFYTQKYDQYSGYKNSAEEYLLLLQRSTDNFSI